MNGVGIGIAVTAAVPAIIRPVLRAGRTVCYGVVTGTMVPATAGLRVGPASTRITATTVSASGSAGQFLKF